MSTPDPVAPVTPVTPGVSGVTFPPAVRFVLGLILAAAAYFVVADLQVDESTAGLVVVLTGVMASVGVVPPKPGDWVPPFLRQPWVAFLLTAVVAIASYLITVGGIDPTLAGVLVGVVQLLGSIGIVPPQTALAAGQK